MKFRFLPIVFIFLSLHASAVVNVCVDANGLKTFTDTPCPGSVVPSPVNQVKHSPVKLQSHLYVKPPEKRITNFGYIWSGSGYQGFLRYFFSFVGGAGVLLMISYLFIFIYARLRKRTSGIVDAKS